MPIKPSKSAAEAAEQLDSGYHWWDPVITYSFPLSDPGSEWDGFNAFTIDQVQMVEMVLALWSDVADITFAPADDSQSAELRFFNVSELPAGGQASFPDEANGVNVHINPTHESNLTEDGELDTSLGGKALQLLLHEIGHALGLDHPGNYDFDPDNPDDPPNYYQDAEYFEDSLQYTVMSYFGAVYTDAQHYAWASTPLLHDIYAIQQIYGANMSTREGDTVYGYNSTADRDVFDFTINTSPVIAIWDAGGIDTLDLSGSGLDVRLDLEMGAFSDIAGMTMNVAIAHGTVMENAIGGSGDDMIVGNRAENVLYGGLGDDELHGEQFGAYYKEDDEDADELHGEDGNDTLRGGFGLDLLYGGDDADDLDGGAGDDELNGGAGGDLLKGDAGLDRIHGGSGDDFIYGYRWWGDEDKNYPAKYYDTADHLYGGDGDDTIYGSHGNDWIDGDGGHDDDGESNHGAVWTGNDHLYGEDGIDTIQGGGGRDTISGGNDGDFLYGDAGEDYITGDLGNDELSGGEGADELYGSAGEDELYGDEGDDWLHGGQHRDVIHGDDGIDTASYYDEKDRWTIDLVSGLALNHDASYDELLFSIENLELGSNNDTAYGTDGTNEISGAAGNDTIEGRGGNDILLGGAGMDTLRGGDGDDLLDPGAGNDFVFGDGGIDTLTYQWTKNGVLVHLAQSEASGAEIGLDIIQSVQHALGGSGGDRLYGNGQGNLLDGGDGNDTLAGFAGNDTLLGGAGRDRLMPGLGHDTVDGGEGSDTVDYSDTALDWTVNVAFHSATAGVPLFGVYTQTLAGIEHVTTGSGNDTVIGDNGGNTINGNDGDDFLAGGGGNDTLYGGKGSDTLVGSDGIDRLFGGGDGDVFSFHTGSQTDIVFDFEDGVDRIDLSFMIGYESFEALTIVDNSGDAVILMGADNVVLNGITSAMLDSSDFIFG
jgi:serralysin